MAQQTPITPGRIACCAMRFTRLNDDGTPAAPPNNGFVSRKLVSLQIKPSVQAAVTKTLVGACDSEIIATWIDPPYFMGFELSLSKALLEPALESLMMGGVVIFDDSTIPVPIGVNWPQAASNPPPVAIEAWSRNVIKDHAPAAADTGVHGYPYTRWLFPWTQWAPDNNTLDADFQPVALQASCRGNLNWGSGPWGDQPWTAGSQGFYVYDTIALPAASGTFTSSAS